MQLSDEERVIPQNLFNISVSALEWLFLRYNNDLCQDVLVTIHDEKTAKTIIQDLFIYIWENRLSIRFYKSIEAIYTRHAGLIPLTPVRKSYPLLQHSRSQMQSLILFLINNQQGKR